MVGSSREIWCSNQETGRFHEKVGDSRENRESWQVCSHMWCSSVSLAFIVVIIMQT